jgi:hypothetical protein
MGSPLDKKIARWSLRSEASDPLESVNDIFPFRPILQGFCNLSSRIFLSLIRNFVKQEGLLCKTN